MDDSGSKERPVFVGLGHELGHSRKMDLREQSYDKGSGRPSTTPPSETNSIANENANREEHGLKKNLLLSRKVEKVKNEDSNFSSVFSLVVL